ncbi:MAG: TRAP transporter substrate-binding protein [Eubacteriales bacterium]|jgi:tripartite ATP-independent transporter DctP family solute receptor
MKKMLCASLATMLTLSFTGCGVTNLNAQPSTSGDPSGSPSSTPTQDAKLTFKMAFNSGAEPALSTNNLVADEIEKNSNGEIKVERYFEGQLYNKDEDGSVAVSEGTAHMILMSDMMSSNAAPEIVGYMTIPFAFSSKEHCAAFLQSEYGDMINEKLLEAYGVYAFFDALQLRGGRMLSADRPITSPDDLKGLKLRIPAVPTQVAAWETLGVSVTPVPLSDLYSSLQTGVVNAQENPIEVFYANKFQEVQSHLMLTNHQYSYRAYHVNKAWWDSVSSDYQTIMHDAMKAGAEYYNTTLEEMDQKHLEEIEASGVTVIPADQIDIAAFKEKAIQSTLDKFQADWMEGVWEAMQAMDPQA